MVVQAFVSLEKEIEGDLPAFQELMLGLRYDPFVMWSAVMSDGSSAQQQRPANERSLCCPQTPPRVVRAVRRARQADTQPAPARQGRGGQLAGAHAGGDPDQGEHVLAKEHVSVTGIRFLSTSSL
jgi:hypothetical protein